MDKIEDNQEWEISKENVMPIKQGRSVGPLNQALQSGTPQRNKTFQDKINEYEQLVRDYIGSDPISPWIKYINWVQENTPTDTRVYLNVIERCLQKFTDSPLYAQDTRFLRLWILYINAQDFQAAKQAFAFMRSHNICTNLALFFLAETLVYEQNGEYEKTEKFYQEGLIECAKPVETIKRHQHQFHKRMRRKCINQCKEQQDKGEPIDPILSPVAQHGITMPALRRLEELYKQSKPTTGTNRNFGVLQEVHKDASGTVYTPSQGLLNETASKTQGSELPFQICNDSVNSSMTQSSIISSQWPLKHFEGNTVQSKENERIAEDWSKVRFKQQPGAVVKQPVPFVIYSEPSQPSLQQPKQENYTRNVKILAKNAKQPFGFKRELFIQGSLLEDEIAFEEYRSQFYSVIPDETSNIALETPVKSTDSDMMDCDTSPIDLKIPPVRDPAIRKLDFKITPVAKGINNLSLDSKRLPVDGDDMTINTRGVLNEMSDMFGNKEWSCRHEKKPIFDIMSTVKKSQKRSGIETEKPLPFAIYTPPNANVDEMENKENEPNVYLSQFTKITTNQNITNNQPADKQRIVDSYHNVIADVDMEEESITRGDSEYMQQILSSQPNSRKTSTSAPNRISDIDESTAFLTGRRDTADMNILNGLQELFDTAPEK